MIEKHSKHSTKALKICMSITLMLILVIQSVSALADIHQLHQIGMDHLTFEHSHKNSHDGLELEQFFGFNLESNQTESPFDCHHCCHCHGLCMLGIMTSIENLSFSFELTSEPTQYVLKDANPPLNQQYRPPRS